ncbi:translation initiation factor IF-2 [Methylobacter svalbardensis]|uniref:translation initiation factor IF-2 n=1 Tax=Methylobacter svalbardensis TaxID=3080016 RepID=UPI0030ECB15B
MSNKTVRQLAEVVKIPLERLLEQLKEAGLSASAPDDVINEDEKMQLLAHLRKRHGKNEGEVDGSLRRVTLKRRTVSELKQSSVPGSTTKTISVEVRKQKTYIKRNEVVEPDEQRNLELAKQTKEQVVQQTENVPEIEEQIKAERVVLEEKKEDLIVESAVKPVVEVVKPEVASVPEAPSLSVEEKTEILPDSSRRSAAPDITQPPASMQSKEEQKEQLAKSKEATEARKKQQEKDIRLEESIKRNADKVRQQASAKQEILHRKKQEEGARAGAGGRDAKRPKKKGKKAERVSVKSDGKHQFEMPVEPVVKEVSIPEMIMVSDLAQKMSVKAAMVIKHLMKLGIMATINQSIDQETAAILVEEMGHKAIMQSDDDLEQEMLAEAQEEDNRVALPRAPIVTIMGHVDHGKTSLLDYIRKTRVAAGEAGGITQHIGAYQVKTDHGSVTFLDTPGHAAFTAMRARGADVTDVVIVVVAADDGVMPQTREAVEHARAANVPIIVAMNKMDKPAANPDKVMQELSTINVLAEEWGGDVQFLKISAKTGEGIDELIEALIVQTEILELKAPVEGPASGIVIESRLDKGRGVVATVLIQKGTLESGQMVLCGHEYGRVRAMFNENGKTIKAAGPCAPVEILGLSGTPNAGDEFLVVQNERIAKDLAKHREDRMKLSRHAVQHASKLDEVFSRMATGELASVNLVLKTDVQGSLEALRSALIGLSNDEVEVKVVFGGVGGINEGDANLALASGAILMGFNVRADTTARKLIEEKGIDLHYYSIIYEAIDEVKKAISGMLAPEIREQIVGLAEVRDVFKSPKFGAVAGCMVIDGFVKRNLPIRVLRENVVIYEGQLESLRRFKDDAAEVKMGMECGIGVKNYNDVQPGDQIEVFERIEVKREL